MQQIGHSKDLRDERDCDRFEEPGATLRDDLVARRGDNALELLGPGGRSRAEVVGEDIGDKPASKRAASGSFQNFS